MTDPDDWHHTALALLREHADELASLLTGYFNDPGPGETDFSGRLFERFIARSDPLRFTTWDLVAVSSLSVNVAPRAAAQLLLDQRVFADCVQLLADCPDPETKLAEASDAELDDDGPLSRLYWRLREIPDVGPTTASKLLAAKRPNLVPIRDSVVSDLVGARTAWWLPYRELVRASDLVDRLDAVALPGSVSSIRRIDVVLWRLGKGHGSGTG